MLGKNVVTMASQDLESLGIVSGEIVKIIGRKRTIF